MDGLSSKLVHKGVALIMRKFTAFSRGEGMIMFAGKQVSLII